MRSVLQVDTSTITETKHKYRRMLPSQEECVLEHGDKDYMGHPLLMTQISAQL